MKTDDGGEPTRMRIGRTGLGRLATTVIAGVLLTAGPAVAHETLIGSQPEADAVLPTAPHDVTLIFTGELSPDGSFEVTDAAGHIVGTGGLDLDVAERNVLRGAVTITAPGRYEVHWVAAALDGHPISGELAFTVGDAPNTATSAPADASTLGLIMLLAASVLAIRLARVRRRP